MIFCWFLFSFEAPKQLEIFSGCCEASSTTSGWSGFPSLLVCFAGHPERSLWRQSCSFLGLVLMIWSYSVWWGRLVASASIQQRCMMYRHGQPGLRRDHNSESLNPNVWLQESICTLSELLLPFCLGASTILFFECMFSYSRNIHTFLFYLFCTFGIKYP